MTGLPIQYTIIKLINYARVDCLFILTKQHIPIISWDTLFPSVQNVVLHQAQQVAVKSFSVFFSGCSRACVSSVCGALRWWD